MSDHPVVQPPRPGTGRFVWIAMAALLAALALLSARPAAWARPSQAPDYQTVPTRTPTPTRPGQAQPTATPTDTPQPPQPPPPPPPPPSQETNTPTAPLPTATATATPTAAAPLRPTATPLPPAVAPVAPVAPRRCWTAPTPGFAAVRSPQVQFDAQSPEFLVVPGQSMTLRLTVANRDTVALRNALICAPLNPALERSQPTTTQGRAQLEAEGLVVELGNLAPGATAEVQLRLTIPPTYPLGSVIESQAWLFADGRQASTELLTWALPPAWLPPTGR